MTSEEILKDIRAVIGTEARALTQLSTEISLEAVKAVEAIFNATQKGKKVVVSGMGKSGYVARKIATTLSSTGTLAVFLHPSEGMHGDLGLVQNGDVVLAIGRSGESDELNVLIPNLKKIGVKIVSITAHNRSTLAKSSDICIVTGEHKEAGPYDLAPTTSSMLAMAVGDALAMTLMKLKDFKPEDYALYHPGGQLGRRLVMKVEDVMVPLSQCPVLNIKKATFEDVIVAIGKYGLGVVLFGDSSGVLDGIITDGDLRRLLNEHKEKIFSKPLDQMINKKPIVVKSGQMAMEVLKFMEQRERPLNVVPVIEGSRVLGLVRIHDLLKL